MRPPNPLLLRVRSEWHFLEEYEVGERHLEELFRGIGCGWWLVRFYVFHLSGGRWRFAGFEYGKKDIFANDKLRFRK